MSTKDTLLDHAERLMRHHGAGGASFCELAKAAGIKSASVHYHFPTKDDLIAAAIARYSDRILSELGPADDPTDTPRDRISRLTDNYVARLAEDGAGCLCAVLSAAPSALGPLAQGALHQHYDRHIAWVGAAIARLQGALGLAAAIGRPDILEQAEADILSGI